MKPGFHERLEAAIRATKKSNRQASLDAGLSADAIRHILRNPENSSTIVTVEKLSKSVGVPPEWLAFGVGDGDVHDVDHERLPIQGDVAAGLWLEVDGAPDDATLERADVAYSPSYPRTAQFGLRVRGTSINRRALEGDILRCVSIADTGIEPQADDLVIVERLRDGGSLREVTAKVFVPEGKVVKLMPDSTDDVWKPIVLDSRHRNESTSVRLIAVVDMVARFTRRRRP